MAALRPAPGGSTGKSKTRPRGEVLLLWRPQRQADIDAAGLVRLGSFNDKRQCLRSERHQNGEPRRPATVTYTYLGRYQLTVPEGTFSAALVRM